MLQKGELLGQGAFGQVWSLKDNKSKVVKESHLQSPLDDNTLRELYALTLPEHPDLIRSNRVGKIGPSSSQIILPRAISSLQDKLPDVPLLSCVLNSSQYSWTILCKGGISSRRCSIKSVDSFFFKEK